MARLAVRALLLLAQLAPGAVAVSPRCRAARAAMWRAASAGLAFYADGSKTGAANTRDRGELRDLARAALANATAVLADLGQSGGSFREQCASSGPRSVRAAAEVSHALLWLLLKPSDAARGQLLSGEPLGEDVADLFDSSLSWSDVAHSGWPVFRLAAMLENEIRRPTSDTLTMLRLYAEDESEGCTYEQEVFREASVLLAGEGRTARLQDVREFLRQSLEGDESISVGPKFILDIMYGDLIDGGRCPAAYATAFAALADALQCHYHRPRSLQTHELADAAVERAQRRAAKAFSKKGLGAMLTSRWPIMSFLARLEPPPLPPSPYSEGTRPSAEEAAAAAGSTTVALVSWSSREAELGGLNWAEHFVAEVFGGLEGVELRVDMECADIYVFRSKVPINFGGVLVFVDGERSPEDGNLEGLLANYPASIVVGPRSPGGRALHLPVPYVSTSFASRAAHEPSDLLAQRRPGPEPRHFAAYLAYRCWEHRERFFHILNALAREAGLEGVDVLSRCGNTSMTESDRRSARYSATYMDDATALFRGYRFALVFENRLSPRYVTEKIVSAFLAGTIPIYWGSPFVLRLFSPHAFVYVNGFVSFEAAARRVVEIARDPALYEAYLAAPMLQNTSAARWPFSWHRRSPPLPPGEPSLREELAAAALERHRAGLGGVMPAVERRPWDYVELF